jgi:hypothetical protein
MDEDYLPGDELSDDEHPVKFDTYEYEGHHYHHIGLVQMWQRGYVPEGESWSDPPRKSVAFQTWLDTHNVEWLDFGAFGPPQIKFPDDATMEAFRLEWHEPGEQRWMDYLNGPEAKALEENNRRVLEKWLAKDEE